jgi:TonB family protein
MSNLETTVGSVEVVFAWRDAEGQRAVIDAELVDGAQCPAVWIGSKGQRFMLPSETAMLLGAEERHCLVRQEGEHFVLRLPEAATVSLSLKGQPVELGALIETTRSIVLTMDHVADVQLGEFSFFVRPGAAPEKAIDRGPLMDLRAARWGLAAFAAHAAFVGTFFFVPPNASALNLDINHNDRRYIQATLAAIEEEREELQIQQSQGNAGQGATEPDAAAGAGNETPEVHISGGPGRRDGSSRRSEHPVTVTRDNVLSMGVLAQLSGGLADMAGSDSPFGNPDMIDGAGGPGFEHLIGGPGVGGWGGLNMNGPGRGTCTGEHCGDGTIAQGELGTHGPIGDGPGGGVQLDNTRRSRVPGTLREGVAETSGGLSREQVRRTIRQHINEVRFCYEQELMSRPDLEGRVSVRFMVNANGAVGMSTVADSSGATGDVGSCVSQAMRRWSFPSSSGPTLVTYPFVLQSAQ